MVQASAKQVFNFCSGPAMLPESVMIRAQHEFLDYQKTGISIMEMSHRSPHFMSILESAEQNLRRLLTIPSQYSVLFMQGGASLQFSAIPLNLMRKYKRAGFLDTGYWSRQAMQEAARFGDVVCVGSSADKQYKSSIVASTIELPGDIDYLHYTPNETIDGVAFSYVPDTLNVPLVADMSSCILSSAIDVSQFGLIYAGAQKNIGPAGLGVVIVRNDLLGSAMPSTPRLMNYQTVLSAQSMANTPPTYAIYLANLVFEWLLAGSHYLDVQQLNVKKAALLYAALDESPLVFNDVESDSRSIMNVPFFFNNEALTPLFLKEAEDFGLLNLKGHRSSGGCRASIYNAMPVQGVEKLVEFIKLFENKYV